MFPTSPLIFRLMLLFLGLNLFGQTPSEPTPFRSAIETQGLKVELQIDHAAADKEPGVFRVGDHVAIGVKITDTAGGTPMKSLYPAAWLDSINQEAIQVDCMQKVKTFLSGSIFTRAEIDLNVYYVVTLTKDGFLTVVDPLFSFGGSKLLAMIELEGVGADWVLTRDRRSLFISIPETRNLVRVDTYSWEVTDRLAMPGKPGKLLMQPDEHYLWVAYDQGSSDDSGVVPVDRNKFTVGQPISTGAGVHDLAMDRDNRTLFASNSKAGTVSVIDVAKLTREEDIAVGKHPISMTYSKTAGTLLVADHETGQIAVINTADRNLVAQMQAEPGLRQVAFSPEGRLAFAINPQTDTLYIVDAASRRIIQSGTVDKRPSFVTFSETLGYIMHQDSDQVLMVPLTQIGVENKPIPLADFSGGVFPVPGLEEPIVDALVKAPAEHAVMLANTADGAINYYQEGMTAPMGSFTNYDHPPKAIMVLDRSLQEDEPGLYQTATRLTRHGLQDLVLFMESPRIIHCFKVPVLPDLAQNPRGIVSLKYHDPTTRNLVVNQPYDLRFQLTDGNKQPIEGLTDVVVIAATPDGLWQKRMFAKSEGAGVYLARIKPSRIGRIQVFVRSDSVGLEAHNPFNRKMNVVKMAAPAIKTEGGAH